MSNIPRTKNPEKWNKDVALSKADFATNKIGTTDINDLFADIGLKPLYNFKDGKSINLETGEVIDLFPDK